MSKRNQSQINGSGGSTGCPVWHPPRGSDYTVVVGVDDLKGQCLGSSETRKQIVFLGNVECRLMHQDEPVSLHRIMLTGRDPEPMASHLAESGAFACALLAEAMAEGRPDPFDLVALPRVGLPIKRELWNQLTRRTLFDYILRDRMLRVDQKCPLADRPPMAVITVQKGCVVRLEVYMGHDALRQIADLRSDSLKDKCLLDYLVVDNFANDPVASTAQIWGFSPPARYFEAMHTYLLCDHCVITVETNSAHAPDGLAEEQIPVNAEASSVVPESPNIATVESGVGDHGGEQ